MPSWEVDHPITHWTKSFAHRKTTFRCVTALFRNDIAGTSQFCREVLQLRQAIFHRQYRLRVVDVHARVELQGRNYGGVDGHQTERRMVGHQMPAASLAILTVARRRLRELAEILSALGDADVLRFPQREGVHRSGRPGTAGRAMAV